MADPDLDDLLAGLWAKNRGIALDRLRVVREALARHVAGSLDGETAEVARGESHKLAGALGMYGFPGGSELATRLEQLFTDGTGDARALAADAARLEVELTG